MNCQLPVWRRQGEESGTFTPLRSNICFWRFPGVELHPSTVIDGGGFSSCVLLADGASLTGFTLTHGRGLGIAGDGGGVQCISTNSLLTNCLIEYNRTVAEEGGTSGLWYGGCGGGAWRGTLYNCALSGNVASYAGGTAYGCRLCNCIVDVGCDASTLNYCCGGNPTSGVGNITNNPLFVDCANGNLRLQPNSPCINAGNNGYVASANELEGRPRIIGRTVDMGAYEFQLGVSGAFIGWLQQYGLPTTGPADHTDPDLDGMNNWQEWVCGTCPTNAQSVLRVVSALPTSTNDRELAERGRGELLPIAEHQSRVAVHVPGPKYRRAGSYQRTGKDCFC